MLGLELYYDAFWELSTCRATGLALGPIPWSAIKDYAVTFGLDEAQEEDLFYLVRAVDNAFLSYHAKGTGQSQPPRASQSSSGAWTSSRKR